MSFISSEVLLTKVILMFVILGEYKCGFLVKRYVADRPLPLILLNNSLDEVLVKTGWTTCKVVEGSTGVTGVRNPP